MIAASIIHATFAKPTGDGNHLGRCPVPSHGQGRGDRRPSLSFCEKNGRVLVHCHAGCDPRDVLDALRKQGGLPEQPTPSTGGIRHFARMAKYLPPLPATPDARATSIWRAATPVKGTPAEAYLRRRGFATWPPTLRYSAAEGAMVAAVQARDHQLIAVQITRIDAEGYKRFSDDCRRTIGSMFGAAVRLAPAGRVLGLAEGVESGLAAMAITGVPVWASLGAKRLSRLIIPDSVEKLVVFADDDDAGRAGADVVVRTHRRRAVEVRLPPVGVCDWNDLLMMRGFVS